MSWKAFALSILTLLILWGGCVLYISTAPRPALHIYVAYMGQDGYKVTAESFETDGFCTVFIKSGRRFAAVCGQHTVSEAEE